MRAVGRTTVAFFAVFLGLVHFALIDVEMVTKSEDEKVSPDIEKHCRRYFVRR